MKFADLVSAGEDRWLKSRYLDWLERRNQSATGKEPDILAWILTKNPERTRTGSWSASSAGSCIRKQQFVYLGKKKPPLDTKTLNIFRNGDYMHLRHQVAGIEMGYLNDVEVRVELKEYHVRGTVDGVCSDGQVAEFKSMNSYGFDNLLGPREDHLRQVHAYMLALDTKGARILYENKNSQEIKEFDIDFDDAISNLNIREWKHAQEGIETRHLMTALPITSQECRWCPFKRDCRDTEYEDLA